VQTAVRLCRCIGLVRAFGLMQIPRSSSESLLRALCFVLRGPTQPENVVLPLAIVHSLLQFQPPAVIL